MTAMGAKKLLQIIIGAGESRDALAVEQPRPITPADFEKVVDGGGERAGFGMVLRHRPQEPLQAPLHHGRPVLVVVVQDRRRPMDPAIGDADVGPQRRGRVSPAPQDRLQASQGLGHGPLCSTRSRLSAMALRRSWR
jgi:hypothetical protein